jgi:hypothetical protein
METEKYKEKMIREHLSTVSYRQITEEQAMVRVHESIAKIKHLTTKTGYLEAHEHTYFERSFKKDWRIAHICGGPKIHKPVAPSDPIPLRPIASGVEAPTEAASNNQSSKHRPHTSATHSNAKMIS